jgi:hypothetical protein
LGAPKARGKNKAKNWGREDAQEKRRPKLGRRWRAKKRRLKLGVKKTTPEIGSAEGARKKRRLKLGVRKTTYEIGDQKNLKLSCEFRYTSPKNFQLRGN